MGHLPDFYGCICQPRNRQIPVGVKEGRSWCYDNDCFNGGFDPFTWWTTLTKLLPYRKQCLFIATPDVVGDAYATKSLWYEWYPRIKSVKLPVAYVVQNGQADLDFPEKFDWIFVGGDDDFKEGDEGARCIKLAKALGKKVHMGRVNSYRRLRYAKLMGCDTVDGTYICFGKNINTPKLTSMMNRVIGDKQCSLF